MSKAVAASPVSILPADRVRQESLRLLLQAAVYDPLTRRFLAEAGLSSGMRVLDVGSGPGSVSLVVSDIVGPEGTVVGIESSAAMVELARRRVRNVGRTNIEFVQGNAESPDLSGPFDAVVGRFVIREIKDAAGSLGRLARLVAPGGIVAFQEKMLCMPVTSFPTLATVERARSWMDEARRRAGVETAMGAKLAQVFTAAGLPSPELRLEAPIGYGPDWVGYDYLAEMLRGMLPLMHLYGIATEEQISIDTLAGEMRDQTVKESGVVILTPCIGAWAAKRANGRAGGRRT